MKADLTREEFKRAVDQEIETLYTNYLPRARNIDARCAALISHMKEYIRRGGKGIRPYLTYLGYSGCGGTDYQNILPIAASQELLHNFLLIHDDIIDRDDTHYHGPNISGIYTAESAEYLESDGESQHYGHSVALLAGDINHSLVSQLIADSSFEPAAKIEAIQWVNAKIQEVIGGQLLEMTVAVYDEEPTLEQLLNIAKYKTASYSFECPLLLGALLAGADTPTRTALTAFASNLGIAYQLQDDLIGMFGTTDTTGKPVISDLREGKRTLLMHYGWEQANKAQTSRLKKSFKNPAVTSEDLMAVRTILEDTGAKQRVMDYIDTLVSDALAALPSSLTPATTKNLTALSQKTLHRTF